MAVARTTLGRRARACGVALALVASGCSAASTVDAPQVLPATATPSATPPSAPTPTPTAVLTATPAPTPTPLPTPTPTLAPLVASDVLESSIDEDFAALDELGVQYSFGVYVDGIGYVDERGAGTQLLPASNQKLITAMGALELLDPDFQFETQLRIDADNNLFLVAGGDPTLTRRHLQVMARAVARTASRRAGPAGVPLINDVVVDASYFPSTRSGPGWPDRYIPVDVGPMSALIVDNNQHRGDDDFVNDPDFGNAELLVEFLEDAGLQVVGVPRVGLVADDTEIVAKRSSPRLLNLVNTLLNRSDNEVAEAIVRQIGLDYLGEGEIAAGKSVILRRLNDLGLELTNAGGDGSGLSRDNRLSARELIEAITLARAQRWWPTFQAGLPNSGGVGTLAIRLESDTTTGIVRAKTGTLFDVTALSGTIMTIDDVEVVFGFLINGERIDDAVDHLDRVVVALASSTIAQLTAD